MTDKQIIIDGVNVSECERHCSDNRNNPNMCYSEMTRTYSNCNPKEKQCNFYITSIEKQLKRKEQECERLKKAYARLNSLYNDNCDYTDKLEKTITEIKETAEDFGFNGTYESYKTAIEQILQKINECEEQ